MSELFEDKSNCSNVCQQFLNAQITGKKIKYQKIPLEFIQNGRCEEDQSTIWEHIQKLDGNSFAPVYDGEKGLNSLEALKNLFENVKSEREITVSEIIYTQGGVEVILRTLFNQTVRDPNSTNASSVMIILAPKIRLLCLEMLSAVSLGVDNVALAIGKYNFLLEYLFTALEDRTIFLTASALLEDLLAANRKIVDLSKIKNLRNLMTTLREASFPGFCRILSTAVADIDFSEERCTLLAQDRDEQSRSREKTLADLNQALLLAYPEFLSRMIRLASKPFPGGSLLHVLQRINSAALNSTPTLTIHQSSDPMGSLTMPQVLQNLVLNAPPTSSMHNLSESMSSSSNTTSSHSANESLSDDSIDDSTLQDSNLSAPPNSLSSFLPLPVQVMNEVMHKVEILYVLTLFLCGKYKHEVQSKLSDLKFIPALNCMFDKLGWNTESERFPRHNHHETEDCDCTPESALKIQFLRFIHSFCDHNDKRYLLLSMQEVQEMKEICDKYRLPRLAMLEKAKSKYRCRGLKGLITKVIEVLKRTPPNNALRFWLSRAVEGFLRGSVMPPDQHFLINRGLIKHLFDHIINPDTKSKEIIQSSFDLLGELMKFNVAGFQRFNDAIDTNEQFEKFLSMMTSNVVDSNMFIRCTLLSQEKFASNSSYDVSQCRLSAIVRKWGHKIYLMYKLITAISVDSLTQENVSCLNTTLIFLMFAYNHGQLDKYFQAFVTEEEAQTQPGFILSNLRDLLLFWRTHYLRRGKDCSQLEQSSSITFDKWQNVVDIMLNEDVTNKTSLLFYMSPIHRNSTAFRTVDYGLSREV